MAVKTLEDIDVKGKRVIVRCDFNVPMDADRRITDQKRIIASLPTIRYILDHGAKLILMSHLGRPKGKSLPEYSLAPVAESLRGHLGIQVKLAPDSVGAVVESIVADMNDGDVILLENLRYHKEEADNNMAFSEQLAGIADVYVNDAFGTAHRAHASTEGITHFMDELAAGYLLKKEIDFLISAIKEPKRPFVAVIGGAKIAGKIDVITTLLEKADLMLIGGGMAYTFFKAMGYEIGKSLIDNDRLKIADEIIKKAENSTCELFLPVDFIIADKFDNDAETRFVDFDSIPHDWECLGIGPKTADLFTSKIIDAGTVFWNGPMGAFEMETFAQGTKAVADAMAKATEKGAVTIIGGGDSAAAIAGFGMEDMMSHISTGGGASLELLEGKTLPGVSALDG